ncbi:MAG: hypothetical protein AABZ22_04600 [Nitrospirota bacterium]
MARRSKREYVQSIYHRYQQAGRAEKTTILTEFTQVCGYHRKYAIRLLNHPLAASRARGARRYGPPATARRWSASWRRCGRRPAICAPSA